MKHKRKRNAVFIAAIALAGLAQSATLTWYADVLLDTDSGTGDSSGDTLWASAGVDLYLIYNGPAGTPFPGVQFLEPSGVLAYPDGSAIPFVDTYTTTATDFANGFFSRDVTGVELDTFSPKAPDWEGMNNYSFTILAIVDTDGGDYSTGGFYGVYTGDAARFSSATGSSGTGYIDAGIFNVSGSGTFWPWGYVEISVESAYGSPDPGTGSGWIQTFSTIDFSVNSPVSKDGTNYICTGWIGSGDIPSSGTSNHTGNISIFTNSSIAWNWVATNAYRLDVSVDGAGSLNVSDGWQAVGATLTVVATPEPGWLFMGWSGDLSGDYAQTNTSLLMNIINRSRRFSRMMRMAMECRTLQSGLLERIPPTARLRSRLRMRLQYPMGLW